MTMHEIFGQLNHLSCQELCLLREEINRRVTEIECGAGNVDVDTVLLFASDLTGGLSEEAIGEMVTTVHEAH